MRLTAEEEEALRDQIRVDFDQFLLDDFGTFSIKFDQKYMDSKRKDEDEGYKLDMYTVRNEMFEEIDIDREFRSFGSYDKYENTFGLASIFETDPVNIYNNFCEELGFKMPVKTSHIIENESKTYGHGRKSLRQLCYPQFVKYLRHKKKLRDRKNKTN